MILQSGHTVVAMLRIHVNIKNPSQYQEPISILRTHVNIKNPCQYWVPMSISRTHVNIKNPCQYWEPMSMLMTHVKVEDQCQCWGPMAMALTRLSAAQARVLCLHYYSNTLGFNFDDHEVLFCFVCILIRNVCEGGLPGRPDKRVGPCRSQQSWTFLNHHFW